jgi:hypothetical protein
MTNNTDVTSISDINRQLKSKSCHDQVFKSTIEHQSCIASQLERQYSSVYDDDPRHHHHHSADAIENPLLVSPKKI